MWFRKHRVCEECGVYFEPPKDVDNGFLTFCKTHRAPLLALAARKKRAMDWAKRHWEECEQKVIAEDAGRLTMSQSAIQVLAGMQANTRANAFNATSPSGGLVGGLYEKQFKGE